MLVSVLMGLAIMGNGGVCVCLGCAYVSGCVLVFMCVCMCQQIFKDGNMQNQYIELIIIAISE